MSGPVFNQPNWTVSGDVYNTNGDLILTPTSTKQDLTKVLLDLKTQLAALEGVSPSDRQEIEREVDAAAADAQAPSPPADQIKRRLDRIKERLGSLGGAVAGALALAKSVAAIAGWVAVFL